MARHLSRIVTGVVLGLALSLLLLPVLSPHRQGPKRPAPPVAVPDNAGRLDHVVLHYVAAAADSLLPTYSQLLAALHPDVRISIVVEEAVEFDDLVGRLADIGVVRSGMEPVVTGYAITPWSRDRYTLAAGADGAWYLVVPEAADGAVQQRFNDWMVPWALADGLEDVQVLPIPLRFDGGDLLITETHVFASAQLLRKNLGTLVNSREQLVELLGRHFGREVFLFGENASDVPTHHLGMYITPLPDGRIVMGDPDLGLEIIGRDRALELGADISDGNLQRFRNAIADFEAAGFEVERLPLIPLEGSLDYITYNNLIMETRDGLWNAFVPTYQLDDLDAVALERLASFGVQVTGIDVSQIFRYDGSVRCLVNVLQRSVDPRAAERTTRVAIATTPRDVIR